VLLLKGLNVVIIVIGTNPEIGDVIDIEIDPLLTRTSRRHRNFAGSRYLLSSIIEKLELESLADVMKLPVEKLEEELQSNQAEMELVDIISLFKRLQWDSEYFGINIAYISCLRLTPNIDRIVKEFTRKEKIDLLQYLCNCHDKVSVINAERSGYSFVDMRLTFEQYLNNKISVEEREDFRVDKGCLQDIEKLRSIASDIYKDSRYYYDGEFDKSRVVEFYINWIEKAILGTFDDYAYVIYKKNEPVGFCTVKEYKKNAARIGLVGIDKAIQGSGMAKYLMNNSLMKLQKNGIKYVEVATQGRNYEAQRVYQKCGFLTKKTELWYHKWFH
jgi:dTDP-4-amino-4,6-dideoxy-D-galactose acyltransferase